MSVIENIMNIPAEHEKNVFGSFDGNIKKIERTLHVTVIARDSQVKIMHFLSLTIIKNQPLWT